ncbi:MAG: hypothetical protein JXR96_27310 [Deltaproteobacteria bacterium]|nr:hypothetical protein [Deltaproteobacteria bacterium]
MRLRERIPRQDFEAIFRPMVRQLGTRTVILRLNEAAQTAIPRQTKLAQLMPKLEILVYERARPKVDEELERLWNIHFEDRLGEAEASFDELSKKLNAQLDQDRMPEGEKERQEVGEAIDGIAGLLREHAFADVEIDAVFRIKAFPEVLDFYLERSGRTSSGDKD